MIITQLKSSKSELEHLLEDATNKILSLENCFKLFANLLVQLDDFYDQMLIENDAEIAELHEVFEEVCNQCILVFILVSVYLTNNILLLFLFFNKK